MKPSSSLILAAGLALAGIFVGLGVYKGVAAHESSSRIVTVKGLAEREVKADKVTWPLAFKDFDNDLLTLTDRMGVTQRKIVSFLRSKGISELEISVNAPEVQDRYANLYSDERVRSRYFGSQRIIVSTDKVDLVRSLILEQGELLSEGIALSNDDSWQFPLSYEFTGLNAIKPEMIEEATRNARAAAEKLASDSDLRLGKIKTASQGQFSIDDRDAYTPYLKNVRVVTSVTYYLE